MSAPDHLGLTGKRFFDAVVSENSGLGPEDYALLEICCEALDTIDKSRRRLAKDGVIVSPPPHHRPQPHPAVEIRQAAQIRFQSALKQLDLGIDPEDLDRQSSPYGRRVGRHGPRVKR
jgi:P27 family predicted phage terminase small subunit